MEEGRWAVRKQGIGVLSISKEKRFGHSPSLSMSRKERGEHCPKQGKPSCILN